MFQHAHVLFHVRPLDQNLPIIQICGFIVKSPKVYKIILQEKRINVDFPGLLSWIPGPHCPSWSYRFASHFVSYLPETSPGYKLDFWLSVHYPIMTGIIIMAIERFNTLPSRVDLRRQSSEAGLLGANYDVPWVTVNLRLPVDMNLHNN